MTTTFQFYNTVTETYGRETATPYLLDGLPGPLPPDTVELTVIRTPAPEPQPDKRAFTTPTLDLAKLTLTHVWDWQDIPAPSEVSDKQILYWLIDNKKYDRVLQIINTLPDPTDRLKAQIQFQRSGMIQRQHPMTLFVMNAIPLTPAETDQAFREMALISV